VKTKLCKKLVSLTLAFALMIGMMPAIPGAVSIAHGSTTITEVSVTGITAPEVGQKPVYSASVAGDAAYYIGVEIDGVNYDVNGISWAKRIGSASSEIASSAIFEEGISYDVRMELYAKDGYTFDEKTNLESKVTINGQPARVISRYDNKLYIGYIFPALEAPKTIESIELSHECEIEANAYVKNLKVSKINGEVFDGEKYAGFQWYRDLANFNDISNATAWNGSKFEGGYAYGLQINNLPKIDGYGYHNQVVVSIKTPGGSKTSLTDQYGNAYFYWNKLDYKPALESVNIKMDGYYVGENVMSLTFKSDDPIVTTGSYGKDSGLYTIRQYNSGTGQYDVLSNTSFVAGKKYYLFYRLQSDLDIYGLEPGNVKLDGKAAFSRHVEDGKQYYAFSLDELTVQDIVKTPVTSIVVSLPKAQPAAGDDLYYPTVISVNGDTNLSNVVSADNTIWYQNDFHVPEEVDYAPADNRFVQGKSYILWMSLTLAEGYKMADTYNVTVQTPSGNLEGILDSDGESYVTYEYYFNLGAPTELPMMTSYAVELSGYQAGAKIEDTALTMIMNGLSLPKEMLAYGMIYTIANENQEPILKGPFDYDTQYYLGTIVAPYNCKIDGLDEAQIKSMVTLHGMHPESVTAIKPGEQILGWEAYFKLPILKQDSSCNGLNHEFIEHMVPATFDTDGKFYQTCSGCGATGDTIAIPKVSSAQLTKTEYTHNGKIQCPDVVVKDSVGKALTEGQDYSLIEPDNSIAVGTYTIKVILQGNYSGTKDLTFKINAAQGPIPTPTPTPTPTPDPGQGGNQGGSGSGDGGNSGGSGAVTPTPGAGGSSGGGTTPGSGITPGTGSSGGGTTPDPGTTPGSGTTPGTGGSGSDGSGVTPTPIPIPTPTPEPGTGTETPDTPATHQHSYIKTVTKATAKKDGSIVEKCACGYVKSKTVIKKASKIKLSKSAYVYTGKVIKAKNLPKVIVKDSAGKTIAKSNYTIVKPKNVKKMKALGKYAYTIKFKGSKYKGSVKVYLEITPAKVTAKAPKAAKKAVTVKWKKGKKAQVTGYQVTVATNKKFTKNVKTKKIKGYSKTSCKMTKLKAKTKYYVKVRAYKTTKTGIVYGPWSVVKNAKTK